MPFEALRAMLLFVVNKFKGTHPASFEIQFPAEFILRAFLTLLKEISFKYLYLSEVCEF